jgi:HPt (histidine-containing phosphotransfer) domain-containing protein
MPRAPAQPGTPHHRSAHSSGFPSLTYRDPTGETAVRNLTPGNVSITWPNGFTVWVSEEDLAPLLAAIQANYSLRQTRRGHFRASRPQGSASDTETGPR